MITKTRKAIVGGGGANLRQDSSSI